MCIRQRCAVESLWCGWGKGSVQSWTGNDWRPLSAAPPPSSGAPLWGSAAPSDSGAPVPEIHMTRSPSLQCSSTLANWTFAIRKGEWQQNRRTKNCTQLHRNKVTEIDPSSVLCFEGNRLILFYSILFFKPVLFGSVTCSGEILMSVSMALYSCHNSEHAIGNFECRKV